jgi:YbbR domain-containing protein
MLERLLVNWPWKLLSLALAFALWLAVTGEDTSIKDFTVPIHVELSDDRILGSSPPTNATVRLAGPESLIRELDPLELGIRLDLRDVPSGERDVQLGEAHLEGVPSRAGVVFIEPSRVRLVIDRRMLREVQVVADIEGEPPQGYTFYQAIVTPEQVTVEGPASEVDAMSHVRTDTVYVDRRTRAFVETVGAVPERPTVRLLDPAPIEVQVVIDEAPVEMAFDGVPVELPESVRGAVSPKTARVTLLGPRSVLERMSASRIRAFADVGTALTGGGQAPLRAELVDVTQEQRWRLTVKSVDPQRVSIQRTAARSG